MKRKINEKETKDKERKWVKRERGRDGKARNGSDERRKQEMGHVAWDGVCGQGGRGCCREGGGRGDGWEKVKEDVMEKGKK